MARVGQGFRNAVAFAASQFGLPLEEARKLVHDDWSRNGNMIPGWLPANWRDGRLMYTLKVNAPIRWIDLTAAESIASLNRHIGSRLEEALGIPDITLATLAGEDRESTTLIAEWLREQILDDGNFAAGVRVHSKYGGGACWAYWMRRRDDGLGPDPVEILEDAQIHRDDPDLQYVLAMYGLKCR